MAGREEKDERAREKARERRDKHMRKHWLWTRAETGYDEAVSSFDDTP